jgi:TetR/AcrR family transcriptional regulator, regulator of mycofactocin system
VAEVALDLFSRHGFARTTVDAIAAEAGISRRSFFRYFDSKNDVVWGDFDALLRAMEAWLADVGEEVPVREALTEAVVRFNAVPPEAEAAHRQRMSLILQVPALQAHSTLRYAAWRDIVTRFVARRLAASPDSLLPRLAGHVSLGAAVAAYEQWLADADADLAALLTQAFATVELHLEP